MCHAVTFHFLPLSFSCFFPVFGWFLVGSSVLPAFSVSVPRSFSVFLPVFPDLHWFETLRFGFVFLYFISSKICPYLLLAASCILLPRLPVFFLWITEK